LIEQIWSFITSYYYFIIWLIFYLAGTIYIYSCGTKNIWQEMRVAHGLVEPDLSKVPPIYRTRTIFGDLVFLRICFFLFFRTCVISAVILALFYTTSVDKKFVNMTSYLTTTLSLLYFYSLFVMSPSESQIKEFYNNNSSQFKVHLWLSNCINLFSKIGIQKSISMEQNYYRKKIKSKIRTWYNSDGKELGVLVIRLHELYSDFLPEEMQMDKKEYLREQALNILFLYANKDTHAIYDKIVNFIELMLKCNVKYYKICEFFDAHEMISNKTSKRKIEEHIKQYTEASNVNNTKKGGTNIGMDELSKVINLALKHFSSDIGQVSG